MRPLLLTAAIVSAGCTYPEFHFAAPADTDLEESSAMDSTAVDTFVPDDAPPVDSSLEDTFVADTRPTDTRPDTVADVPVSTGCATSTAKFCADWDKATTPYDGFTNDNVSPTGSIAIDTTGGRSLPNAFRATTSPGTTDVIVANVSKVFTTAAADSLIKLDAWIKLDADKFPTTAGGRAFLLKIQRDAGEGDGVTFSIDEAGFLVDRIGLTYEAYAISSYKPKVGTWMHVRVQTRIHTTAGSLTVFIDNMTTPVFTRSAISTARVDSTAKQAIVGLYSESASATFRARYDDVELDY